MVIGEVISNVIATRKNEKLQGYKLLVVKPYYGESQDYFVAVDNIGAGVGEIVLITTGEPARHALGREVPIDSVVVGIVDGEPK